MRRIFRTRRPTNFKLGRRTEPTFAKVAILILLLQQPSSTNENTQQHVASHGLSAIAELVVFSKMYYVHFVSAILWWIKSSLTRDENKYATFTDAKPVDSWNYSYVANICRHYYLDQVDHSFCLCHSDWHRPRFRCFFDQTKFHSTNTVALVQR